MKYCITLIGKVNYGNNIKKPLSITILYLYFSKTCIDLIKLVQVTHRAIVNKEPPAIRPL